MILKRFVMAICMLIIGLPLLGQDSGDKIKQARQLLEKKDYRKAESVVREALKAAPENAEVNQLLGASLLGQNKAGEAEKALLKAEKALPEIQPKSVDDKMRTLASDVRIGLARIYMEQKQLDKAADKLSRAEKIQPGNPELYFYRGMLNAHRKDYAATAQDMDKVIKLEPKRAEAYYYAGIAYNQIKKPDKMVERFQQYLKLAPDTPEAEKVKTLLRAVR